jgi:hypothetical protein
LLVLAFALLPPMVHDTHLYYTQSIIWDETYPVVPGIGNMHGRLGFNSNLLLMSAAFSVKDLFGFRVFGLLSLFTIVLYAWIIAGISTHKSVWVRLALSFFIFAFLFLYHLSLSSPSTDPFPNMLVAFVLIRAILDKDALQHSPLVFWLLPVFCLTLKLSVAPLCLLSLLLCYYIIKEKQYRSLVVFTLLALFILVPWCARNVIITGYLIYPFPAIDIFNVDWKIPIDLVQIEKGLVSSWAKMPGLPLDKFEAMPFWEWAAVWLLRHIRYMQFYIFTFCLAGLSPFAMCWLKAKLNVKVSPLQVTAWIVGVAGSIFWFFMAPDVRFGFSFILMAGLVPLFLAPIPLGKTGLNKIVATAMIVSLFYFLWPLYKLYDDTIGTKPLVSYLYSPQSVGTVEKAIYPVLFPNVIAVYTEHKIGNTTVYISNTGFCYEYCFPCMPYGARTLEMRGDRIEDGFRVKK